MDVIDMAVFGLIMSITALLIGYMIADRKVKEKDKEIAVLRLLDTRHPTCLRLPCGRQAELYYSATEPDYLWSVCCYGNAETCDGKRHTCTSCILKDHGFNEAQDGWTELD